MRIQHRRRLSCIFAKVTEIYDSAMWKKGSKLYSVWHNKCPRCQEGDFFVRPAGFRFKDNLKTHENCSNCGLKYMIEPSFFYGAMYVSYAITVAMAVAVFVICQLFDLSLVASLISILVVLILANPFVMRVSRLLYINMFISFKPEEGA
jgi:uncharacterized protein (DUF983 family)